MRTCDDTDDLPPEERRRAVAALLARGVLRLPRRQASAGGAGPAELPRPAGKSLELPAESRLSVPTG